MKREKKRVMYNESRESIRAELFLNHAIISLARIPERKGTVPDHERVLYCFNKEKRSQLLSSLF
jgi:hypothetical protein